MKKKLGALVRVVVSVGILAYLFNGIFQKEVTQTLGKIADSPNASVADLAHDLRLRPDQVELVRAKGIVQEQVEEKVVPTVNLKNLTWSERFPLVWTIGPRALWEALRKISALWLAAAVICAGIPGPSRYSPVAVDFACAGAGGKILAALFDFIYRAVLQCVHARVDRRRCDQGLVRGARDAS